MASSKDFEKIWKSYQDVAQPKGVSIVDHCQRNGIVYSQFQRWYQKHIDGVSIILVEDRPSSQEASQLRPLQESPKAIKRVEILYVSLVFSNGLKVHQKSISYDQLKQLVEKLEGLC